MIYWTVASETNWKWEGGGGLGLSEILTRKEKKGYDYVLTLQKKGDVE